MRGAWEVVALGWTALVAAVMVGVAVYGLRSPENLRRVMRYVGQRVYPWAQERGLALPSHRFERLLLILLGSVSAAVLVLLGLAGVGAFTISAPRPPKSSPHPIRLTPHGAYPAHWPTSALGGSHVLLGFACLLLLAAVFIVVISAKNSLRAGPDGHLLWDKHAWFFLGALCCWLPASLLFFGAIQFLIVEPFGLAH